jgi:hypothetical protein
MMEDEVYEQRALLEAVLGSLTVLGSETTRLGCLGTRQ